MNFIQILKDQLRTKNLSHAYLLFGSIDKEILREVFQTKKPDFFTIEEIPIKINHIRELTHWLNLKPHSSKIKLAVLCEVENLTLEAANSLLKALEEPPESTVLILQAFKKEKILPTIISRCQIIREEKKPAKEISRNYLSEGKIANMSIKERFDYVNKLSEEKKNLSKILNLWEQNFRQKMLDGNDVREILKQISKTRSLLLTNSSVKLLLENLILKF